MRNRRLVEIVVVLFLLLVFGCDNPTGTDISLDEEAIRDYILSNDDEVYKYDSNAWIFPYLVE
jgi:hypothetical protein